MAFDETDLLRVLSGADLREEIRDNLVSFRWAVVTSLDPLQVRREGELSDIDITGTSIPVEALRVGDRVRVSNHGSKAFIETSWDVLSRTDETIHTGPNANDKIRQDLSEQAVKIEAAQGAAQDAVDEAGQALAGLAEAVVSTTLEYVLSVSEIDPPGPEAAWSEASPPRTPGSFIWMRVKATRANDQVSYSQPTITTGNEGAPGGPGAPGNPGAPGVSVDGVVPYFRLYPTGSDQPHTPSGDSPSGWSTTEPAYAPGQDLWRSERVNFSDGDYSYTTPQRSSAYAAALYVGNLAEQATQGLVKVGTDDPGHYPGRIWWQTNSEGDGIGIKVSVSDNWVPYTIVADQILVPSSVGSVQIKDNAITAGKLAVDALDFKEAEGITLTSATIISPDIKTDTSGARVEMDQNGLRAYNASGSETFSLTGSSGSISGFSITGGTITGATVSTGSSVARIEMSGDVLSGYSSGNRPTIQLDATYTLFGDTEPALVFRKNLSSNWIPMVIRQDGITFLNSSGTWYGRFQGDGSHVRIENSSSSGDISLGTSVTGTGSIRMDVTRGGIYQTSAWQQFKTYGATSGYDTWTIRPITIGNATRAVLQFSGGGNNMPQTTVAANMFIDSNGSFYRTSSARRFKNDIQDIGADPYRVLNVSVRDWVDATIAMDDDSYQTRTPGVVAEEVEEAGLSQFVTYDEDGQTSGVMYDRLTLLLIPVVRDLYDRLKRLENQT